MEAIEIAGRRIGTGEPCYIIAEVGLNHNGQLHVAKVLVDIAAQAGADAVKFQKRRLESLYVARIVERTIEEEKGLQYLMPFLQTMELSEEEMRLLKEYCDNKGITFLCTPWDVPSADFLDDLGVPAFKCASADLTNHCLIDNLCRRGRPLVISTGMSTMAEIEKAVALVQEYGVTFALLHCNSTYPAPFQNVNLRFMQTLSDRFGVPVGYSGHELGIAVAEAAVAMGACILEKHLTLDRTMAGPDHAASLEPAGLNKLIRDVRNIETAFGDGRKWLSRGEFMNREALGKSLVAACDIEPGARLTRDLIDVRSPGKGIPPYEMRRLIGTKVRRRIHADDYFREIDLELADLAVRSTDMRGTPFGIPIRPTDLTRIDVSRFDFLEFHLSDRDLERPIEIEGSYPHQVAIHVPEYSGSVLVDFTSRNPDFRDISRVTLEKAISKARELRRHFPAMKDIPIPVIVHPGGMTRDIPLRDAAGMLDRLVDAFKDADYDGVTILLENMPPRPWYFGGQWFHNVFVRAEEVAQFAARTGKGICFDVSHAALACHADRTPLVDYVRAVSPHICHGHFADAAGIDGEGLQIGEGTIDFRTILPTILNANCTWILEIWQGHKFGGEGFFLAAEKVKDLVSFEQPTTARLAPTGSPALAAGATSR